MILTSKIYRQWFNIAKYEKPSAKITKFKIYKKNTVNNFAKCPKKN